MNNPEEEKSKKAALSSFADSLLNAQKEDKKAKKEILKKGIEERENSEKSALLSSRLITSKLSDMRSQADMSAFVGTSGKIKSPKFKRKEFISLLARELLLIGNEELTDKGGIISLAKLQKFFDETRDNWELRENDIKDALNFLMDEKMIPNYEKLDENIELIYFKPIELSTDTRRILMVAHGIDATKKAIQDVLGWDKERVQLAISQLVRDGLAVEEGDFVFFPGLY